MRRAHQISAAVFEDEFRSVGLTPAQFGVLKVLQASPGLDQSSLARALGFDKVTVLRVLRVLCGLEARRLAHRTRAVDNKRSLSVALSQNGEKLLRQSQKPAERAYRRLMMPFSQEKKAQLLLLLMELPQSIEEHARAGFVSPELA